MTAFDDMPTVATAMHEGAVDFSGRSRWTCMNCGESSQEFWMTARRVRTRRRTVRCLHWEIELVGRDPGMIEIYKIIGQLLRHADQRVDQKARVRRARS